MAVAVGKDVERVATDAAQVEGAVVDIDAGGAGIAKGIDDEHGAVVDIDVEHSGVEVEVLDGESGTIEEIYAVDGLRGEDFHHRVARHPLVGL